ncbi:hypothetical protein EVAR_2416_1 [Eumeta japonica]|uniref:Uncharacterized protein n=1 Tax=Eumeta variegata TaxID=151549 RepID=A0A4C1SR17_EUMVA|nr:hypothetical protein EVAR_2416_1 [Eumeta japonica]
MTFFGTRLAFLNAVLSRHFRTPRSRRPSYLCKIHSFLWICDAHMNMITEEIKDYTLCSRDVVSALKALLDAFETFVKVFQYQFFITFDWASIPISILFNFSLFIGLNKTCADFLRQVKSTRVLCVYLLSVYQEDGVINIHGRECPVDRVCNGDLRHRRVSPHLGLLFFPSTRLGVNGFLAV